MPNTPILNDREELLKIDTHNALGSIEEMGSQISQIWEQVQQLKLPETYHDVETVVVAGMGGSVLGTHVVQTLFKDQLSVPVIISPDYEVPAFVNDKTLVIASSYSGNTEETLAATQDAFEKGAKLIGITTGGKIATFLQEKSLPVLAYEPTHNPSQCARMGLGYSVFGQIALFSKVGLIQFTEQDYQEVLEAVAKAHLDSGQAVDQKNNLAKVLAFNLLQRIPVITVSEHLEGIAHVFSNQLNENAKTFAEFRVVPEMHHHLLEGLAFPEKASDSLVFVTIHSEHYHTQNKLRMEITEEILEKHSLEFVSHKLSSKTKIGEAFELLTLGAYAAYYLAILNNQDPIPNPQVDWLKSELKKRS